MVLTAVSLANSLGSTARVAENIDVSQRASRGFLG
jgi:hypothetical protein